MPNFNSLDDLKLFAAQDANKQRLIVVYGKKDVLDVTDFVNEHPGGGEVLEDFRGCLDIKDGYNSVGHSAAADKQLKTFIIGVIDPDAKDAWKPAAGSAAPAAAATSAAAAAPAAAKSSSEVNLTYVLIGLATVVLAVGGYLKFIKK